MVEANRGTVATALAVGLLCACALWAPLALGATGEWPRFALEASTTVAVMLWAAAGASSRAMLAPVCVLLAVLFQLLPLPDRLLGAIAPVSAAAWKVAHAGVPDAWGSISVDPAATAAAARRLFLAAALVAAVTDLSRRRDYRLRLTTAASVTAVAIVAAGLLFPVVREERIVLGVIDLKGPIEWWRTPLEPPQRSGGWAYLEQVCVADQCYQSDLAIVGDAYGSYICCNKFAGAVCLTLPVALAALLFVTRGVVPLPLAAAIATAAFAAVLWIVGIRISSRAGAVALIAGVLTLVALVTSNLLARRVFTALAACYLLAVGSFVVVFLGQWKTVTGAFPASWQPTLAAIMADARVQAAHVAARMFRASPAWGTGLGTYEAMCPRMMGGGITQYYAHNDYAQLLAETGFAGLVSLMGLFVCAGRCFVRFCRRVPAADRILEAGPWAALVAIGVHSVFDWNLHIPANAFLACLNCGLAFASGLPDSPTGGVPAPRRGTWRLLSATVFGMACVVSLLLLFRDASADVVKLGLRRAIVANRLAMHDSSLPSPAPRLRAAVAAGEHMTRWAPRDSRLHALLAQANLHLAARANANDAMVTVKADECLAAAAGHARRALLASPVVRGLPQPAPPGPKRVGP